MVEQRILQDKDAHELKLRLAEEEAVARRVREQEMHMAQLETLSTGAGLGHGLGVGVDIGIGITKVRRGVDFDKNNIDENKLPDKVCAILPQFAGIRR